MPEGGLEEGEIYKYHKLRWFLKLIKALNPIRSTECFLRKSFKHRTTEIELILMKW